MEDARVFANDGFGRLRVRGEGGPAGLSYTVETTPPGPPDCDCLDVA